MSTVCSPDWAPFAARASDESGVGAKSGATDARTELAAPGCRGGRRLDRLDAATIVQEMNVGGYDFHRLHGAGPPRYTVHVNGPWCIVFEFQDGDAYNLSLEQYH